MERSLFAALKATWALVVLAVCALGGFAHAQPQRPNIVLIVVDDAAFMDFGAYGGEARTPTIDRLAETGAMFINYRTSPLCSPSRAMLLTGVDNHRTGHATIEEVLPPELEGRPGYTLRLEPGVRTIADRLKAVGYRTLMAGKWHLGRGEGDLPDSHGFDRSLALDASGADNYAQRSYMPYYDHAPWFEDGRPTRLPKRFYSSDLLVDRLASYIDEQPPEAAPYFAYLAFQAVHIPVQAPRSFSDAYTDQFKDGWEALREQRWRRARDMGLVADEAPFAPMPAGSRRWADLTAQERQISARSMEVYSGMLTAMDAAIGRLVRRIEDRGELERTIFVITSDNGPEPSDPVHAPGMNIWMALHGYHWDAARLGEEGSLAFIGPEWAAALSSPHSGYKFYTSEGGLKAPLIMSGPGISPGRRADGLAFVSDVTPTLLDLVAAPVVDGEGSVPITGKNLAPVLRGEVPDVRGPADAIGVEVSGNAALYRGDYKIVRTMAPIGDGRWRLYNLQADPGETRDLAKAEPQLLAELVAEYEAYAARSGVLPLPEGYQVQRQVLRNGLAKQVGYLAPLLILIAIVAAFAAALALRKRSVKG